MSRHVDCIFCKIISHAIPSSRVFENEEYIGIRDIYPQAKSHFLIIPKVHFESLESVYGLMAEPEATLFVGKLFQAGRAMALAEKLLPGGYRAVINTGKNGGQTVFHLHLHVLGGEVLNGRFG